jgi:hypothetical protein
VQIPEDKEMAEASVSGMSRVVESGRRKFTELLKGPREFVS